MIIKKPVIFVLIILVLTVSLVGTTPTFAAIGDVTWSGTTNQGRSMSFTVHSTGTQWGTFILQYSFPCGVGTQIWVTGGDQRITNGTFGFQGGEFFFTGQFTSSSTASGTFTFTNYSITGHPECSNMNASGTWTASRSLGVISITRASPNPTTASIVDFTVTFSKDVTGVDKNDFSLTTSPGISGASISTVTLVSASVYTITVNTGSGRGTIRLDVVDNDSIVDGSNPLGGIGLGNGNFTSGEIYMVRTLNLFLPLIRR